MNAGTKPMLLTLLLEKRGEYLSGGEIAGRLHVSRTAVWKAVNSLRQEGYVIEAVRNRGYCLAEENDMLSVQGVRNALAEGSSWIRPVVLSVAEGSTNDLVRARAASGAREGLALIAGAQTAGKGRSGRSFFSPPGSGIYLSLLLRPGDRRVDRAVRITTMAAVAACRAIEKVTEEAALIKWVNDIYVRGRKAAGILTEASMNVETGLLDYAVLGIGFNVYEPEGGFPQEIKNRAGCILETPVPDARNRLAGEFLNQFSRLYNSGDGAGYEEEYRRRSFVVGRSIKVISGGMEREALALEVGEGCCLRVRYQDDGSEELLSSGEVSIRELPEGQG